MREKLRSRLNLSEEYLTYESIRQSVACLRIYYDHLEYTLIDESPSKTPIQLISDFGGNAGLLIGCSLLNLVDVLELFVMLISVVLSKQSKINSNNIMLVETRINDRI